MPDQAFRCDARGMVQKSGIAAWFSPNPHENTGNVHMSMYFCTIPRQGYLYADRTCRTKGTTTEGQQSLTCSHRKQQVESYRKGLTLRTGGRQDPGTYCMICTCAIGVGGHPLEVPPPMNFSSIYTVQVRRVNCASCPTARQVRCKPGPAPL